LLTNTTLRTAEEVRDVTEMASPALPKADPQMLAIAEKIVEQQSGEFDPAEFVDRYEDALRAMIEEKKKGHAVKRPEIANDDTNVVDLMAALKRSLKGGGGEIAATRRSEPTRRSPAKSKPRRGRSAA